MCFPKETWPLGVNHGSQKHPSQVIWRQQGRRSRGSSRDSQLQTALMEFQTEWEMKSCRGSLRVTEGSRRVERETKERSYPNSINGHHTTSIPVPCKQYKGPGVTFSHMQDLIKSGFPAALLISSWCRCGCTFLLKRRCLSNPSSGGELCLSSPLPGISGCRGKAGVTPLKVPPMANHGQHTQPTPCFPLQSLQEQCAWSLCQICWS